MLLGSNSANIKRAGHNQLSTHGLLRHFTKKPLTALVYQLVEQKALSRTDGDRPIVVLNEQSWQVMRGELEVKLIQPSAEVAAAKKQQDDWHNVDKQLFETLREFRKNAAAERGVPPFTIFHDSVLRDLARHRPTNETNLLAVKGIGQKQLERFGDELTQLITQHCNENDSPPDQFTTKPIHRTGKIKQPNPSKDLAFQLFDLGSSIEEVAQQTDRAESTAAKYLSEWIHKNKPDDLDPWLDANEYDQIADAAANSQDGHLTPIYESLDGQYTYNQIRIVIAHLHAAHA